MNDFGSIQAASPAKSQRCLAVEETPQSCRCKLGAQRCLNTSGAGRAVCRTPAQPILTYWYNFLVPPAGRGECAGRSRDDRWACVTMVLVALQRQINTKFSVQKQDDPCLQNFD